MRTVADARPSTSSILDGGAGWIPGVLTVLVCASAYLLLRPPLYDFDGYMYRLYASLPGRVTNANPQHLLWNSVQLALVDGSRLFGSKSPLPFQIFGILVNCTTLFLSYRLLRAAGANSLLAAAGTAFIGFSPQFWFLGLQNEPYPLTFLFIVLLLSQWQVEEAVAPRGLRLLAAGLFLSGAILLHQAAILLLPAAALALVFYGSGSIRERIWIASCWACGIGMAVFLSYLGFWHLAMPGPPVHFGQWLSGYVDTVHPIQLFQLGFVKTAARSAMGLSGTVVQDYAIQKLLYEELRPATIYLIYNVLWIAIVLGALALGWRFGAAETIWELARSNPLFGVSLSFVASWSLFAFAWEPATAHYWTLILFPAIVCTAILLRDTERGIWVLAGVAISLGIWNCYFNHRFDMVRARTFSPAFLESIQRHVGPNDLFIVLSDDQWFAGVNYVLLFRILQFTDPGRGLAIFNDLVFSPGGGQSWPVRLDARIDSTLKKGGRVYVAAHVFDLDSYTDLSRAADPFNEQIHPRYRRIDAASFRLKVQDSFSKYRLTKSGLRLGADNFWRVETGAGTAPVEATKPPG
jgi:Protein O-mannosyl-transferase TMEM260-like